MKALRLFGVVAALVAVISSCVHRDFEYESGRNAWLNVVFDWSNEPEANPASMTLYMYPADGGKPSIHEFAGRDGGTIRLEPGIYHAICINSDNRDVYYRNALSHSTFEITTTESKSLNYARADADGFSSSLHIPRAPGTETQPLMIQPPMLWSQSVTSFEVRMSPATGGLSKQSPDHTQNQELRMLPERIVDTYIVTVRKINNVKGLSALSATISDMSDGYLAGLRSPNDTPSTITMELRHDKANATAEGEFLTFGHCPSGIRSHKLLLLALLSDGSQCHFEFDVSDQTHAEPDADNIHHIVVDLLDLPETHGPAGGGFDPSVNEWEGVDVGIEM